MDTKSTKIEFDGPKDIMTIVGQNVRKYRLECGMSAKAFAACFGTSSVRTRQIEVGMANLKLTTVAQIADILGVKVIDLVEDWEDEDNE